MQSRPPPDYASNEEKQRQAGAHCCFSMFALDSRGDQGCRIESILN
ncbi:hypothetical protein [Rhodopirellula europaea]|uniref:Uncharacterized protein n=1 Tax=Rhodopirellula europaea SH398 TaxID=1263868 RepID=M5S3A0_9BACT|nr:hypothetical protein [Rhodopirellula europaea]EMI25936.1 hypothetical protein RESH_03557 [Rhodopirellula europaea SH398]